MGFLWNDGPIAFLVITLIMGGLAATMSGRAFASTWRPLTLFPFAMLVLAAFIRFLHHALAGAVLLNVTVYITTFVLLTAIGVIAYRLRRVRQMTTQYGFLYARSGPFGWVARQ